MYRKNNNRQNRRANNPPYVIDRSRLRPFSSRDTIFGRAESNIRWESTWTGPGERVPSEIDHGRPRHSRIDLALTRASRAVHKALKDKSWTVRSGLNRNLARSTSSEGINRELARLRVEDEQEMTNYINRAARLFGASLVGICKFNRDWVYADAEVPEKLENAIVMAIEMDADAIATSPAPLAAAATGVGYSKMAFTLTCVGQFIRNIGYEALECGNDTALSIPLAIDAGLGELGRNGLLITPMYGPRVRLCKILTDLPLVLGKPIEFGVTEFCKKCKLCARHCEADAISMDDEPSFDVACKYNSPGALKWYVNAERCHLFWRVNGMSCSTCIRVCPYNIKPIRAHEVTNRL